MVKEKNVEAFRRLAVDDFLVVSLGLVLGRRRDDGVTHQDVNLDQTLSREA